MLEELPDVLARRSLRRMRKLMRRKMIMRSRRRLTRRKRRPDRPGSSKELLAILAEPSEILALMPTLEEMLVATLVPESILEPGP